MEIAFRPYHLGTGAIRMDMEQFRRVADAGMSNDGKFRLALGLQPVGLAIPLVVVTDMVDFDSCILPCGI